MPASRRSCICSGANGAAVSYRPPCSLPARSLLAAVGVRTLWLSAPRPAIAAAGAAAAATLALTMPVAWATPSEQAETIWPADPHLVHDAVLARYVRAHTRPRDRILAIW